jgi:NADPH:quinone reductase
MKAIRITETGGPDVMKLVDVDIEKPGPGQVRVRQTAIGLNYIDTYHRSGLYPVPLPSGLGLEAAGVVEELGEGVTGLKVGDRIAYGVGALGAYAELRNLPANRITRLPSGIPDETAAGMMLKGMTVRYLLRATYKVQAGETILLHAAAGGVGLILSQWAKALGVTVIGTVGSDEKVKTAREHGCDHVINYDREHRGAREGDHRRQGRSRGV